MFGDHSKDICKFLVSRFGIGDYTTVCPLCMISYHATLKIYYDAIADQTRVIGKSIIISTGEKNETD